jgi:hypothetical protein
MFLVEPLFFTYFRKFLMTTPSAEMTKGYTDSLLSFQLLFIYRAKFSYFVIFSASVLGRLWVKGTAVFITSAGVFSLSMNTIGSAEIYRFISYDRPVPI